MKFLRYIILSCLCFAAIDANAQSDRQFIRQGNRLFRQQAYDKAETEYRKALSKNDANPQALYNLGCALMMQNKDSAAVGQYELAAKVEKNKLRKAKIYHNMGVICQKHQLYGDAVKAYEESLRNNPTDDETRYNLALCKRQQKNQQQQGGGQNNKQNKDKQKQQKQQQDKQNKDKQQDQKQQQQQEQMSKENAEQLLNAAMQEEKETQRRMKENMRQPQRRQLPKNW